MTKEMPILFVYDTLHCQSEHDDPSEAVLYFHPSWVSDQQRLALCGQLMGTTYFLKSVFSCPKVIELKSGKFVIKPFGRYILAIGTDRNIANWTLVHRAEILSSLFSFYHCDIQLIDNQPEQVIDDSEETTARQKLANKLYQIFETYLPILQFGSSIFQSDPVIRLPKSSSNVFLEAMQTLQFCQHTINVLGGTILYHNKVVATQLSSGITKYLVMTDPHHIKSPAEKVAVAFHLPADTQIIVVYIEQEEYDHLRRDSDKARLLAQNKLLILNKTSVVKADAPTKSMLKRDKSIIFTTVPEEEVDHNNCTKSSGIVCEASSKDDPEDKPKPSFTQKFNRPTHLPLRFKNVTSRDLPDSGLGIDKLDDDEIIPEFKGQTSVCSTPMTDLNKILHGRAMSICCENDTSEITENLKHLQKKDSFETELLKLKELREGFLNLNRGRRRNSLPDLRQNNISNRGFPMRTYGFGLSKFIYKSEDEDFDKTDSNKTKRYRTLSEPCYLKISNDLIVENQKEQLCQIKSNFKTKVEPFINTLESTEKTSYVKPEQTSNVRERVALDRSKMTLPLRSHTPVGPIPLTPLMTKLSILCTLQDSALDATSPDIGEKIFTCDTPMTPMVNYMTTKTPQLFAGRKRVHLLVCGQRNMTLLLLLEDAAGLNERLILEMWETCVGRLPRLESRLRDSLGAVEPDQMASDNEHGYSFVCLDPEWDIVNRGGPWAAAEMTALGHMHSDIALAKDMVELVLRSDESVLYGYQCGRTEMFYQQAAEKRAGIPPPSDLMGSVQIRARRRLERDHAIVLL